ncbi:hypothetical protein [Bradyrhizobium sp.]|jgi:hypothetical protein|nr:hypothetical protein [Bradyrhizobium sp.]HEV2155435.1 hypothetical protein [Bradyrhizobium sp.]
MSFPIPAAAPYITPVLAWLFAIVPTVLGLVVVAWIIKSVRCK